MGFWMNLHPLFLYSQAAQDAGPGVVVVLSGVGAGGQTSVDEGTQLGVVIGQDVQPHVLGVHWGRQYQHIWRHCRSCMLGGR